MGKTYIDTVKYLVHADLFIDGIVEKPDVVGAIFGQTEGLLGEELDLRELQKSGRIGRIEVNMSAKQGKSNGEILLPSSLDRVETSVLAAALETVDRIGPCEAKIKVKSIDDMRTTKREQLIDRAKHIFKSMITDKVPESREISDLVREEVKTAEVTLVGPEKLAAGPNLKDAEHIIVVEGRADVLSMLRADIKNVICLQGKNIPKTVLDLSKQKTVTLFVDGDRGGELIIKNMLQLGGEIEFIAQAPAGKEVEELTQKEIIKCLRRKEPLDQYLARTGTRHNTHTSTRSSYRTQDTRKPSTTRQTRSSTPRDTRPSTSRDARRTTRREPTKKTETTITANVPHKDILTKLKGTLTAQLLDKNGKTIKETTVRELSKEIEKTKDIESVVLDGIITQRLIDIANKNKIKKIIGIRKSKIENKGSVEIHTLS